MRAYNFGLLLFTLSISFFKDSSFAHLTVHQGFTYECRENILHITRDSDGQVTELPIGINPYPLVIYDHVGLVLNRGSHTLTVIDLNEHCVIRTLPVSNRPYPLSISNKTAYITDYWGSDITMIDLETLEGTSSLPMTRGLSALAHYKGNIYRVDRQIEHVFISDAATDRLIMKIPVGCCPRPMIIYDDLGYIVNWASQSVSVIDLKANTLFTTLSVGLAPLPLTVIDGFGYVFSNATKRLTVINMKTAKIIGQGPYQSILGIKSFDKGIFEYDDKSLPLYPTLDSLKMMEKVGSLDTFLSLIKPYKLSGEHFELDGAIWEGQSETEVVQFFRYIWEGRVDLAYRLNPRLLLTANSYTSIED